VADDESQEAEYRPVMPFVVCASAGGPYDDAAFVAGYEAGSLDAALRTIREVGGVIERWVNPNLVPQLDLIAMRHDQHLKQFETSDCGTWVRVRIGHPNLIDETGGPE